jgi:hypothetical protein
MAYLKQTKRSASIRITPTGAPASPVEGQLYFDSTTKVAYVYASSFWNQMNAQFLGSGGIMSTYDSGGSTYIVHTFLNSGIFLASAGDIDILLVGGGGGSKGDNGGGGGSGGLVWKAGYSLGTGTYTVGIGAGGVGDSAGTTTGTGSDTTFASTTFIAKGGGYGGASGVNGGAGGSGGGAGRDYPSPASSPGATNQSGSGQAQGGTSSGFAGGAGHTLSNGPGGGGGGTGAVGVAGVNGTVGNGGVGHSTFVGNAATTAALLWSARAGTNASNARTDSLGSDPGTLYIGGGGSGGTQSRGTHPAGGNGGLGGGAGILTGTAGLDGLTNTGSGGGGNNSGTGTGGAGGSGIVVIRYAI